MDLARLIRFYGAGVTQLPEWILSILHPAVNMLRAEEAIWQAQANRVSLAKKDDYLNALSFWRGVSTPIREAEVAWIRPEQEEWFKNNDIPYKLILPN